MELNGFEISSEVRREDMSHVVTSQSTRNSDLLRTLFQDAERKAEVSLSHLTKAEFEQFQEAKRTELDQWTQDSVYSIASRSGIPKNRIMTMRWVLTWKVIPGQKGAKGERKIGCSRISRP